MKKSLLLIILGNLASFGPFVTDFYLPSLPELADYFSTTASIVQMSLTASMIGLAVGQLLVGPIADKYGRRKPLIYCLSLFVISTTGCLLASEIHWFIFFRLLQGLTGASGLVISKVMVVDIYTGQQANQFFAILTAIQFVAPIIAPVLGGVILSVTSWKGIFIVLGIWGIILLYASLHLKESLDKDKRLQLPVLKSFMGFPSVLRNRRYMTMNIFQAFVGAVFFSYISASPFIFQIHFGLSPMHYGIIFASNAIGLILGSMIVVKLKEQQKYMTPCTIGLLVMCGLTSLILLRDWGLPLFEISLFAMIFFCGILIPTGNMQALNAEPHKKGVAAALSGALAFLFGGLAAPLVGIGNLIHSTVILFMTCSIMATVSYLYAMKKKMA